MLTMTEVTVFSCLLSTRFTADMSYRTMCLFFCLAPLLSTAGTAQTLLLMNVVTLRGPKLFKTSKHFSFHFFWGAKSALPELHLLPGNDSLLNILSGSIEINWELVSGSEA